MFINSPGGSVTAGMGIYDAMQMCRADVSTVCMGLAASMGAFLLTSGARKASVSPNARSIIDPPASWWYFLIQAVDIEIQAKEIMYHKANLNRLMAFHTGQDVKQIDEDTDATTVSPLEAKNYGIIDEIIGGDDAGLKIEGEPAEFLKTKASYIAWGDDLDGTA